MRFLADGTYHSGFKVRGLGFLKHQGGSREHHKSGRFDSHPRTLNPIYS